MGASFFVKSTLAILMFLSWWIKFQPILTSPMSLSRMRTNLGLKVHLIFLLSRLKINVLAKSLRLNYPQLYINIDGIPSKLVAALKRLATFANPEFSKTENEVSTWNIPKYIFCGNLEEVALSYQRPCGKGQKKSVRTLELSLN